MRLFLALALAAALTVCGAVRPPLAQAAPATLGMPPSWVIPLTSKAIVRILQFIDWLEDDLRAQADRRGDYDPPPIIVPVLEGVRSGGSTSAATVQQAPRRGGMLP